MSALVIDLNGTEAVPFGRLVSVELRKLVDTRSGRWLLISAAILTALVLVIQLWVVLAQDIAVDFGDFMVGANTPMGIVLPVLGILSITSEWSQRTAMTTFTLEPSRLRVVLAKLVTVSLVAVLAVVVGLVLAAGATLLHGALSGDSVVWGATGMRLFGFLLLHLFGMLTGFAFGTLFLNSPLAIVVYFVYSFVLPGLLQLGAALLTWFADLQPWVDFAFAQTPLLEGSISGTEWAQLFTSGLLWLVLPLLVGLWRVLRSEVK